MRIFNNTQELESALDLPAIMPGAFRFAKQFAPAAFKCSVCGDAKSFQFEGGGTGYGRDPATNALVCYECCGKRDREQMIADGRVMLYLNTGAFDKVAGRKRMGSYTDGTVSNWPGTLKFNGRVKVGSHNIARYRYDVWFRGPDGKDWHGVTYGDMTQICHCKRLKG